MVRMGQRIDNSVLLGCQNTDMILSTDGLFQNAFPIPRGGNRNFINGIFRSQLHIIKYAFRAVFNGQALRHFPFRVNHMVCAVTQQEFFMNVPAGPGPG